MAPHNNFERGQLRTSRHLGQERLSLGSQRCIPVHPPGVRWPSVALTIRIEHQSCFFSGVARIFFLRFLSAAARAVGTGAKLRLPAVAYRCRCGSGWSPTEFLNQATFLGKSWLSACVTIEYLSGM
jgi:hypothetical protein